jgi:hypothetical protein
LKIQTQFRKQYGVEDIFSNSKFYEIIIANQLNHQPIPGHSGSRDAKDEDGNIFEYKHYKETSSNHTWTFNDFSDNLMRRMDYKFIFAHINDVDYAYPGVMDWYYEVDGRKMSSYLTNVTQQITNARQMNNVSEKQLRNLGYARKYSEHNNNEEYYGRFQDQLQNVSRIMLVLERLTGVKNALTSNKLYELLVAIELNHHVNSEQGGRKGAHDAIDQHSNTYEYKVCKKRTWNFQDISDAVLEKYLLDEAIILAVVDKTRLSVIEIYSVSPKEVVPLLIKKLEMKVSNLHSKGKELRRRQVGLSYKDITGMHSFETLFIR